MSEGNGKYSYFCTSNEKRRVEAVLDFYNNLMGLGIELLYRPAQPIKPGGPVR